ncbi:MAG TPA: HtaA domain-containing protein [Miltoncostaeaceae bacterium]|nr:HtaA domain-containing protein [Miltoncostaeaceae bacterium]
MLWGGRRALAIAAAGVLALGAAGCGDDGDDGTNGATATAPAITTPGETGETTPGTGTVGTAPGTGTDGTTPGTGTVGTAPDDGDAAPGTGETEAEGTITGGETRLRLASEFTDALGTARVRVEPVAPATGDGGELTFPITGGDSTTGTGSVDHSGGIRFSIAGTGVEARNLRVELGTGEISAEIQGNRVPLLRLDLAQANVSTDDGLRVEGAPVTLNREAVPALSQALAAGGQGGNRVQVGRADVEAETG